jgi:heavy metal translocating P-type ATPase
MIPLDSIVVSGEAAINQSSLTGESLPVHKTKGSYVYAGTVVEDGSLVIKVDKISGSGKYDRIVKMIEESEKLKSAAESKASTLADRLVPYCLGATLLTYLLTRNAMKAMSILMVDFSCARKLAMPISVISAMRECTAKGITVKGGKFLEAVAQADTIVFDKTGTLTHSSPRVARVVTFGGNDEREMLRLAACLEEHYPHSIANAVVEEARLRGLDHEERHSTVEYVVAHGISSTVDGKKAVIGSYHFIFEDECCVVPEQEQQRFDDLPSQYSHLYLAVGGVLAAVICIEDPLRDEAAQVIEDLHTLGFKNVVMMTGDSERTARSVAAAVGIDDFYYEVLPEDKASFIKGERQKGCKVIMIGDGVNDSPALSEADAGIAISTGAAIAKEIADITISAQDLYCLVTLRKISEGMMKRIGRNYRRIIGFNAALMLLGASGIMTPAMSALLHNSSTVAIAIASMKNYLEDKAQ